MDSLTSPNSDGNPPPNGLHPAPSSPAALRRWQFVLVFLVVFFLLVGKLRPPQRDFIQVTTFLRSQQSNDSDQFLSVPGMAPISATATGASQNISTTIALLTNPVLIERAARQLPSSLQRQGWANLRETVTSVLARSPDSQNLIEVTVKAQHPEAAKQMARALITVYAAQINEAERQERGRALQAIEQKVQEIETMMGSNSTKMSGVGQAVDRKQILQQLQRALRTRTLLLSLSENGRSSGPVLLTSRSMPNPVARTWPRTLITSAVSALLLTVLLVIVLGQLQQRPEL